MCLFVFIKWMRLVVVVVLCCVFVVIECVEQVVWLVYFGLQLGGFFDIGWCGEFCVLIEVYLSVCFVGGGSQVQQCVCGDWIVFGIVI